MTSAESGETRGSSLFHVIRTTLNLWEYIWIILRNTEIILVWNLIFNVSVENIAVIEM